MIAQIYPEREMSLRLLPPNHMIWHAEQHVAAEDVRPLWGIDSGCRTCVVYCPQDLSCFWELDGETAKVVPSSIRKRTLAAKQIGLKRAGIRDG